MNISIEEVFKTNVYQFRRLLETKRLTFDNAHFVIFGDYPYLEQLNRLLIEGGDILGDEISQKIRQRILVKRDEF